jgi:hypothetical protein
MPMFKVGMSWGFAGDERIEFVEADNEDEAAEMAWDMAIQQVDVYVVQESDLEPEEGEEEIENSE